MKSFSRLGSLGLAIFIWSQLAPREVIAQVAIGPNGSGLKTFDVAPTLEDGWSGISVGSVATTFVSAPALDAHVITNTSDALIISPLPSSATQPPSLNALPRWNSVGHYLQTGPSGNDYLLLLAHLRNNTGSNVTHVVVRYDWDQKNAIPVNEDIPGHRAFYSVTGLPGSWVLIPEFSSFTTASTAQTLTTTLSLGFWTNGASLYLIWADDNGPGSTTAPQEGAYTIDNFSADAIPATNPSFIVQPLDQSVASGGTVSFQAEAIGANPLFYQWYHGATAVSDATNATLTVSLAQAGDAGLYSVVASNGYGSVTSAIAVLTVGCFAIPAIVTPPHDQSLLAGGTLSLNVSATGTAPLAYQWRRNGVSVPGATNANYLKANAQTIDSGLYSVVVSNCAGQTASSNVLVSVPNPPFVLLGLTNQFWRYDESNTDLGTAWRAPGYDDSAWLQGRGLLAREDFAPIAALTNTALNLTHNSASQTITYYFRTQFVFTNDASIIAVVASNYVDDGAVFYLNGTEAMRINMSEGAVTYNTFAPAAGPSTEGVFFSSNLPPSLFVQGTNTLAVEVHQNSQTSSDIAFGLELRMEFLPPTELQITDQPPDQSVTEGGSLALSVGITGQAAHYQWFKDGVAVPGATSTTLQSAQVVPSQMGGYVLVASNAVNVVTSRVAQIVVLADQKPPVMLTADILDATHVLVNFSEPLLELSATNLVHYSVTNTSGGLRAVLNAALIDGTNVLLTVASLADGVNYILTAAGLADISQQQNLLPLSRVPLARTLQLLSFNSGWDFYNPYPPFDEPDPGPDWRESGFDTSLWGQGLGAFIFSLDGSLVPPAPVNTAINETPVNTDFFRARFSSQGMSPGQLRLTLRYAANDGAAFHLNGVEILRDNLPDGLITPATPALTSRVNQATIALRDIPPTLLNLGSNILAVELHQITNYDTQRYFAADLIARAESFLVGPVVLTRGPEETTVLEGRPAVFRVFQAGAAEFQWQINGTNVPGATNANFTLDRTPLALDGAQLRVSVGRDAQWVWSDSALLHVLPDTVRPALLSGLASGNGTITLTFSESLDPVSATTGANYVVTNGLGEMIAMTNVILVNGSNVVLYAAALPPGRYGVTVNQVRDISTAANAVTPNTAVLTSYAGPAVSFDAFWRYDASGTDFGVSDVWAARTYDDSLWSGTGQGVFVARRDVPPNGSGAIPENYSQPARTFMVLSNAARTSNLPSYYFRTRFNSYSAGAGNLVLQTIVDDGAVFHLNGVEIFRLGMASSPFNYATLANRTVGTAALEGPFVLPVTNLVVGTNVLAVTVHQVNLTSSDAIFGLAADLLLEGKLLPADEAAPVLHLTPVGDQFKLTWDGGGSLESAPTIQGEWETVSSTSPFLVSPTNSAQFFRVRR